MSVSRAFNKVIIIAMAMMLATSIVPEKAHSFEKHIILGTITDDGGNGIYLAEVTATNMNALGPAT